MRALTLVLFFCCLTLLRAQDAPASPQDTTDQSTAPAPDTGSSDSFWSRFWISGQANFIRQQHGSFYAQYSGPNSFQPYPEHATSRVLTLYTGFQITKNLEILADVEEAGGSGLSNALGIAGFTNMDVVRNPYLSKAPYMAREMLHYTLPLSDESAEATRNPLSLASELPVRRLELRIGKMSTVDFFDVNSVGSDSHLQFMNWTVINNGAYDYAADTRGYTYGLLIEYYDRSWVLRFGEFLMPTVANGITLDWDLARARADNLELELHRGVFPRRTSVIRLLSYVNHANMGIYEQAVDDYLSGLTPTPSIVDTRAQGHVKYGFGVNIEQPITDQWRAFGRLGWNNGRTESFAYTEVDRTAAIGSDLTGKLWHRPLDKVGAAFVANGISGAHADYLALGGLGFLLGDGGLTYGLEKIFETYYNAHIWRGVFFAADWQHVTNPGYNEVRGPVSVFSLRLHIEDAVPFDKFGAR